MKNIRKPENPEKLEKTGSFPGNPEGMAILALTRILTLTLTLTLDPEWGPGDF
jgi:hypothetical protein